MYKLTLADPKLRLAGVLLALFLAACSPSQDTASVAVGKATAALAPPYWTGGTGPSVTHPPVAWPTEPAPGSCGDTCGQWLPYTRFQHSLNDPRTQDPSNGGTSPQNYVNIASSCTDKA